MPHPLNEFGADTAGLGNAGTRWPPRSGAALSITLSSRNLHPRSPPGTARLQWMVERILQMATCLPGTLTISIILVLTPKWLKSRTAVTLCDYSGDVASVYNVPSTSKVVGQVQYIATPGLTGPTPEMANPDGIGIPVTANHPGAAATFLQWFTSTQNQAIWAGLDGSKDLIAAFPLPSRLSSLQLLEKSGKQGGSGLPEMLKLLKTSQPILSAKAPAGFATFYNATTLSLHDALAGTSSVASAIGVMAAAAKQLSGS